MSFDEAATKKRISQKFDELFPDSKNYQSLSLGASGLDSLELMEIIMELEDIIGAIIPEALIENTDQTIGDLIDKLASLANAQ